ncbi:MAG: cation-translocating P-type ATPase [Caldiserica bacterium]|nr:cation-translocating P-type ATPase [Caldisericota bacterium]
MGRNRDVREPEPEVRELRVTPPHCPTCAAQLERRLAAVEGVTDAEVNLLDGVVRVTYDPAHIDADELDRVVAAIGGQISHVEDEDHDHREERLTLASGLFLLGGGIAYLLGDPALGPIAGIAAIPLSRVLFGIGAVLGGFPVLRRAAAELRRRLLGIDLLVSIAIVGALALGETFEAAALAFLFGLAGLRSGPPPGPAAPFGTYWTGPPNGSPCFGTAASSSSPWRPFPPAR